MSDIDNDGPYFAYRGETLVRIVKALQAARAIEASLAETSKYIGGLLGPDMPPSHPLAVMKERADKALKEWREGAGI